MCVLLAVLVVSPGAYVGRHVSGHALLIALEAAMYLLQGFLAVAWAKALSASSLSPHSVLPSVVSAIALASVGVCSAAAETLSLSVSGGEDVVEVFLIMTRAHVLPMAELALVFSSICLLCRLQPSGQRATVVEYSAEHTQRRIRPGTGTDRLMRELLVNSSPDSAKSEVCPTDVRVDAFSAAAGRISMERGTERGEVETRNDTVAYYIL